MPVTYSPVSLFSKKNIIIAASLILLYAILGFFIAPLIIKSALLSNGSEVLGRAVRVKEVSFNPFALSLSIRNFEVSEPDGERFAGFGELYVNFQLSSLFRQAYTFDEIRLTAPEGNITILSDGNLNFSDLLSSQEQPEQAQEQESELPPVLIFLLQIEKGRVHFSDLARPIPFETTLFPIHLTLSNFSTRRDNKNSYSFTATTGEGERLSWKGSLSVNPFQSNGTFALTGIKERTLWKYIRHQVNFEVTGGSLDLAAKYNMDASSDDFKVELIDGELNINDFRIAEKGKDHTLISIPSLSVNGFDIDIIKKQILVESVKSEDARIECWLSPDGTINLQSLFSMEDSGEKAEPLSEATDPSNVSSAAWQINIDKLNLENYGLAFKNRTLAEPLHVNLEPISLRLKNLSNKKDSKAEVSLALNVDQTGSIKVNGIVCMDPATADLRVQVSQLDLTPLQSYVGSVSRLSLVSGTSNLNGSFIYRGFGGKPEMGFKGNVSVNNLEIKDQIHFGDFLKWDAVNINGIEFYFAPNKLSISEIVAKEPYARLVIRPDKTVNLAGIFSDKDNEGSDQAVYLVERPVTEVKSKGEGAMPISINTFRIENGSVNFEDMSLKPGVATGIQSLNGTVKGLTSESMGRADVLIEGKIDQYASVKISGQVNPLSENAYTDLVLSLKNLELTSATAYSGKFVGYAIEKGKLSLDLKYKLSENILIGENKIVLDQFTFGKATDSPDAITLPVNLAVAILKDREGIIDLDIPVKGDLNDPEFSYGSVLLRAFRNVIMSIVSSPFAALGNLLGIDGEELSFVAFDFGSATLKPEQATKLNKLAQALMDRPSLRLEIKGVSDKQSDWAKLAEKELLNQLKNKKHGKMQKNHAELEDISLSDDEYTKMLVKAYKDKFGGHPRAFISDNEKNSVDSKDGTPIFIIAAKQRLIESMFVDEILLSELAKKRAMQIKDYLIQQAGIPKEQVFMVDIDIAYNSEGDNVRMNLTLIF